MKQRTTRRDVKEHPDLRLYGATAAAGLVGKKRHSIIRWWDRGELEFVRIGRNRAVTRAMLHRFLDNHTVKARRAK